MTGIWKHMDGGIMLWVPVANPDVAATQESLSRLIVYDDDAHGPSNSTHNFPVENEVLPSIEEVITFTVESESDDEQIFTPDSCTLAAESEGETEVLNPGPPTLTTDLSQNLYDQLRSFAPLEEEVASSDSSLAGYDTDRNDFLETGTPCPNRTSRSRPHQTGLRSHHFKTSINHPVRRTLDFGAAKSKVTKQTLSRSTALEYAPSHKWTEEERSFLCCIWRWFRREPVDFSACFNQHFGTNLSTSKIRDQFENHIKLYGPAAFPVYRDVLNVPFHDPGQFSNLLESIATTARTLEIDLQRLDNEVLTHYGRAAKARSAKTRKCFRSLVRKVSQEEKAKQIQRQVPERNMHHRQILGGIPLSTSLEFDKQEVLSDVEELAPPPATISTKLSQGIPSKKRGVALRVWDSNTSRTKYSEEEGFVSEAHALWKPNNGEYLKPFSNDVLLFLSNIHLSIKGGGTASSSFVSVSTSLLQVLGRHASSLEHPHLAIIDLDHPSLQEPNKIIHAKEMLQMLKAQGQAWWARYKGHAEFMIWANVPRESVIHHFPLSDLYHLAKLDPSCGDLLSLDIVQSGRSVRTVSSQLRKKNTVLDNGIAKAIGIISKTFGLDGDHITAEQICSFVARIVNGWIYIHVRTIDIQTKSNLAATFAKALGSRSCRIQDVMASFLDGIEEGSRINAYYAPRRS